MKAPAETLADLDAPKIHEGTLERLFRRTMTALMRARQASANQHVIGAREKFDEQQLLAMGYTKREIRQMRGQGPTNQID